MPARMGLTHPDSCLQIRLRPTLAKTIAYGGVGQSLDQSILGRLWTVCGHARAASGISCRSGALNRVPEIAGPRRSVYCCEISLFEKIHRRPTTLARLAAEISKARTGRCEPL